MLSAVSKKHHKISEEKGNTTKAVRDINDNHSEHNRQEIKKHIETIGQKVYKDRKTSAGSVVKQITLKGAQLGNFTDIYLRPCGTGNLEIKEYPPVRVTGMVETDGNKYVVIDEMKKLVTYTASDDGEYGIFGTWVEFKCAPRGICKLGDSLFIAFADRTVKQMSFKDSLSVENSFYMDYKCSGIMSYKGNLAIGLENGKVCIVDTKGKCLRTIDLPKPHKTQCIPRSLTETPDGNIMFCDSSNDTVMSVKDDGCVVFIYSGMPRPICAIYDPYVNIIVVGVGHDTSEAIHLLTNKGNKVRVLKYRKELGMKPYYMTIMKDKMKLAMCGDSNKIQFYHIEKCNPRTRRERARQAEK